jgi:putative PIN family toxin of toxin-antitoxin system
MRVVVDTSVVIAARRSRTGASCRLLQLAAQGWFAMLMTPALFLEYEAVVSRPEQAEIHGRSSEQIDRLLLNFVSILTPVQVYFQWRPQLRDANDELALEAAINGRADAIITRNRRDFPAVLSDFGIRVVRPRDLLKEILP